MAALLPMFVGIITVVGTFLGLKLANEVQPQSIFALNMVVGLGLGLAIDYSLFILSRYREELAICGPGIEPLRRTLATAGRTVLFSATTVGGALLSLMAFPQRFLASMGIGGVICTAVAATTALVALPALIAVLGPRVNSLAPALHAAGVRARGPRRGARLLVPALLRRDAPPAAGRARLLGGAHRRRAAVPQRQVHGRGRERAADERRRCARSRTRSRPTSPRTRSRRSRSRSTRPRNAREKLDDYVADLEKLPDVDAVAAPERLSDNLWQIDVTPAQDSFDDRTQDLVKRIRADDAPFPVATAGEAAAFADQQASLKEKLPIALGTLIGITLVVLFLLTGSVVLPVKSVLMNFLGLSATFGLLTLIFQEGHLEGVLNFQSEGALNATQPILLFIVAFGLSTDYGVFLLTRIKEQHDLGAPNREAVATGLQRTGRIVTAAALLFSLALGAFATSEIVFIKLVGVGAVLAVLIDSSIIRALLVPALMAMLGTRNWWSPRPLRRVYERFGISEG